MTMTPPTAATMWTEWQAAAWCLETMHAAGHGFVGDMPVYTNRRHINACAFMAAIRETLADFQGRTWLFTYPTFTVTAEHVIEVELDEHGPRPHLPVLFHETAFQAQQVLTLIRRAVLSELRQCQAALCAVPASPVF